ncbi:HNH endonuclease signature motif containing protein [Okeania sp. SIO2B3]|uniref:HNH endonuclease n=1 Tax=Okeania sp. SIO2B3 TaxID=2607784 RepID=UPI0013B7CBA7|nr:HNH endonuclease [Okeania sp. SIO2D1]NET43156.1 HNH endonuclease [Okeania sp. SIO2B3]
MGNFPTRNSIYDKIAQNQNWKCQICGDKLHKVEALEIHHIIPLAKAGTEDIDNLLYLHKIGHKTIQSVRRSVKAET